MHNYRCTKEDFDSLLIELLMLACFTINSNLIERLNTNEVQLMPIMVEPGTDHQFDTSTFLLSIE